MKSPRKGPPAPPPRAEPTTGSQAEPGLWQRHPGALFAVAFGLVFAAVGGSLLGFALPGARVDLMEARKMAAVTPASLSVLGVGTRVLLEARIADDSPLAFRDFVAFERREFDGWRDDGGRRREVWKLRETVAPPLLLRSTVGTRDGSAKVLNSGYEIDSPPRTWRSTKDLVSTTFGERTQRYNGFGPGDAVVVDAVMVGARSGELTARRVYGGTREEHLADLSEQGVVIQILGLIFLGVGLLIAFGGGVAIARRSRPATSTQP